MMWLAWLGLLTLVAAVMSVLFGVVETVIGRDIAYVAALVVAALAVSGLVYLCLTGTWAPS